MGFVGSDHDEVILPPEFSQMPAFVTVSPQTFTLDDIVADLFKSLESAHHQVAFFIVGQHDAGAIAQVVGDGLKPGIVLRI